MCFNLIGLTLVTPKNKIWIESLWHVYLCDCACLVRTIEHFQLPLWCLVLQILLWNLWQIEAARRLHSVVRDKGLLSCSEDHRWLSAGCAGITIIFSLALASQLSHQNLLGFGSRREIQELTLGDGTSGDSPHYIQHWWKNSNMV